MINNNCNSSIQVDSLAIRPLENQISQSLSEGDLKEIRGGFTKLPEPISVPSEPTPSPSDPIICPPPPSL